MKSENKIVENPSAGNCRQVYLPFGGNDTVPISVCRGGGIHCAGCRSVVCLLRNHDCRVVGFLESLYLRKLSETCRVVFCVYLLSPCRWIFLDVWIFNEVSTWNSPLNFVGSYGGLQSMRPKLDRSGKRSGAGRKLSDRERSGERACEKTMERERSEEREGNGAVSGLNWPINFRSYVSLYTQTL